MTIEELKEHCERQVNRYKEFINCGNTGIDNRYEEHKLILDLIKENDRLKRKLDKVEYELEGYKYEESWRMNPTRR